MKRNPRRINGINRALVRTAAVVTLGALGAAGSIEIARADTVSMRGVMGFQPDYVNLGLCPCKPLSHPVMPWSVPTITDRIEQWANTPDSVNPSSPKVALTYSLSTVGALEYLDQPDAKPVEVWAFGSPETPRKTGRDKVAALSDVPGRKDVTFVVSLYDPIADPMKRWNLYAAINSRLSTHLHGYDELDLSNPSATYTAPDGSTTLYYAPEVLPMLKWREKWTTPERMAELDAKYRPRIEAAYDRPVHVPAPSEPEPELAEEETWSEPESGESDDAEPAQDGTPPSDTEMSTARRSTDSQQEMTLSDSSENESLRPESATGSSNSTDSWGDTESDDDEDAEPSEPDASDAPSGDSDDNEGGDDE